MSSRKNIITLKQVGSTNHYAKDLLKVEDVPEGTVIWAGNQTDGRGRGSNKWLSEAEKNLTFSMVLYPHFLPIGCHYYLSKMVSVALADLLVSFVNDVKIKWPNDIYVEEKKIAGILIENRIEGDTIKNCILGIGININQEFFDAGLPNPTSLKQWTGETHDVRGLLDKLMVCLNFRYKQLKEKKYSKLDKEYSSYLYKKGVLCRFKKEGKYFNATLTGVSKEGYLLVETQAHETLALDFGEVEYADITAR